jgi:hypothetical protein
MASQLDLKQFAKKIRLLAKGEEPKIIANTLNRLAGGAHSAQIHTLRKDFKLRNQFTLGSMRLLKANPKPDLAKIDAYTGSKSPYLPLQESGGVATTRADKDAKTMPSLASRGRVWGKAVRPGYRWGKVTLGPGSKFFVLKPGTKTARRGRGRGQLQDAAVFTRRGSKLIRVKRFLRGPLMVKATHWHSGSVDRFATQPKFASVYIDEASKALTRLGAT